MKVELEIQREPFEGQWIFFYKFDERAHLVLAGLSKEYSDFSYEIRDKQKMIIRGKLWGIPLRIFSNGVKSRGTAKVTDGYMDGNNLFFLNRYSIDLFALSLYWLPNEKKSSLFRQAEQIKILIGSQVTTLKELMELFMRSQSKHAFMTFLGDCLYK